MVLAYNKLTHEMAAIANHPEVSYFRLEGIEVRKALGNCPLYAETGTVARAKSQNVSDGHTMVASIHA